MRGISLMRMAWRNLWRNRRRTLLTLSAIAFGTCLALLSTAMQDQNFADMIDLAARLGGGHVTLQHPEYLDHPTFTRTIQDTDKISKLALQDLEVRRAVTRIVGQAMLSTASDSCGAFFVAFAEAQIVDGLGHRHGLDFFVAQAEGVEQNIVAQDVDLARDAL